MNNKLFDRIRKNLYDIECSIEVVKDEFEKANIDVDSFLKTIKVYINNYDLLTKSNDDMQLKLLDEKLDFIRRHYPYLSGYESNIKADINFIVKHKETFFESTNSVKDLPYVVSDSLEPLDSVNIENFYSIENITLSNLKEKKEIYIVGENGDGKTLLLQAIAISLVGINQGKIFDLVKEEGDATFLAEDAEGNRFRNKTNQGVIYNHLLAYGASRNSFCQIEEDKSGYLTLFSNAYDLKSPTKWLHDLDYSEKSAKMGVIRVEKAKNLLKYLLNSNIQIDIIPPNQVVFTEKGSEVSFEQLSAGYKGVITIICDLIARLSERQNVEEIANFQGIVLIDEIELHLHPKWQYSFMQKLRETFPLIQFIVTTHSPTVLLGAGMESVYYQIYKENSEVKISEQREVKNDFLNDIQSSIFNFDVNKERIFNPSYDDKQRQKRAKEGLLELINTIEKEQ